MRLSESAAPSPKTVIRIAALACFVGAALSAIAARGERFGLAHELAGFFVVPFAVLALLYVEYVIVQGIAKRELDLRLGYVQAFGCCAIALYGVATIALAGWTRTSPPIGLQEQILLLMAVYGHLVFLGNVVCTYVEDNRTVVEQSRTVSGWPKSAAITFAVGAAFFVALGTILIVVRPLASQLPVPWDGQVVQLPAGYIWMVAAAPFALFALAYWIIERGAARVFDRSTTRIHFVCTVLAVIEAGHEYASWASSRAIPGAMNDAVTLQQFTGVFAFVLLMLFTFAWNIWTSRRPDPEPHQIQS